MSFLSGNILWNLLWIIPLILVVAITGGVRRTRLLRRMFGTDERAERFTNASRGKRIFRIVLIFFVILLLAVAAARPSWGRQVMQDTSNGRDLLVLFDVSRSMLSDDVKPSRMDHAKWLVREIVRKNPGDRFGLVAFAGESFLICPLTVDRASFIQLVDDLDTDTIPIGGTNVQLALEEAVKAFKGAQGTHKAVILVTDGDELTGRGASVVGELAQAQIPIFAVGVGDPSNPAVIRVPGEDGQLRVLTDRDGNPVKSPLNEAQLTELARRTGGIYVRSTAAYSGLDELETRIKMLERKESEDSMSMFRPIERPAYPLAVAILLLAVFFCVSETRPRSVQLLLVFAALLLFTVPAEIRAQTASLPAAQVQPAQAATPADAENTTEQAAPEPVKSASELYNSGLEQQQVEHDDEKARSFYERAIAASEKEPIVRASSYQNIGVISHLDARNTLQDAVDKLQAQDLNSAEKTVEEALSKLGRAEDLYRESMRSAAGDASVIRNQQILLADLKQAEQIKKQIEELKKLMEQARQQTQQAHDQQQQENQQNEQQEQQQQDQQQSGEQDQQQDQNQQQSGEQDQQQDQNQQQQSGEQTQQQQNQQDQQSAQDMTRQAEDTVSELEQKASEMNQERQKQAAQQAREELEKAREEQEQGNGEKAEEHLKNALDTLNRNQQDQQQSEDQQQDQQGDQGEQEQDEQESQQSGEQTPQPRQAEEQEGQQDQGDMDKQQAEAILNMMSKDELDFKDVNPSRSSSRLNNRVEKDW